MIADQHVPKSTEKREQQMSEATSNSAGWRPATYYPDPAIQALDPRFEKYWLKLSAVEPLGPRRPRGRRSGVVRRRPLSALQRHSQSAYHQVGRGNRRGQHLSQAVQLRQ